jgi:FkbM family methyltransferase
MNSPILAVPANMTGHIAEVLSGCYDIPNLTFDRPPVILDLGANIGSFIIWAKFKWPNAKITAYEPSPRNLELLYKNVACYPDVLFEEAGVLDHEGFEYLHNGKHNTGESSFFDIGTQGDGKLSVRVISGVQLPPADILKLDVEGAEKQILETYEHIESVTAVMIEWHKPEDREWIENYLTSKGFVCVEDKRTEFVDRGLMKFQRGIPKPQGVPASKVNLLIACPCYGGLTYASHNQSVLSLILELAKCQVKHELHYLPNESLIPRARNRFGTMMMEGNYTHLLFLDVDIGFNARDVISLLALDKDIVALPYSAKDFDWEKIVKAVNKGITDGEILRHCAGRPIINAHETTTFEVGDAVQFPQLGTGILLIKRKVFEKMAEDPERKYKLMNNEGGSLKNDYAFDFFRTGINAKSGFYDSEDYRFCLDARDLGFETWLWPNCVTTHTGPYAFICDIPTQASLNIDLTGPNPANEFTASEQPVCTK